MQCPRCKQDNLSHTKFCPECETPLGAGVAWTRRPHPPTKEFFDWDRYVA